MPTFKTAQEYYDNQEDPNFATEEPERAKLIVKIVECPYCACNTNITSIPVALWVCPACQQLMIVD